MTEAEAISPMFQPVTSARSKIVSLEGLADASRRLKEEGKSVVLCHGVFDLLHLGHVRHLEAARREGQALVVTVTADKFVNKGPDRPVFGQELRAEMLAALSCVDYVAVNHGPSAEPVLHAVKPDIYVKGSDYATTSEDVTGKIVAERDAVESHGGQLVFTNDITFSSSALINRYLQIYDPTLQDYLGALRDRGALKSALDAVEKIKNCRVLLVGDAILDEYNYVVAMGKTPKENMIATHFREREIFAGGVFAAANHVAGLCKEVDVLTLVGAGDPYNEVIARTLKDNVRLKAIEKDGAPTTRKTRFIETGYSMRKLFETYYMDESPMRSDLQRRFDDILTRTVADYDVVIITDFGHGLMTPSARTIVQEKSRFLAVNTQTNSANIGFNLITKYQRADYVCIDNNEARLAMQDKFSHIGEITGRRLPDAIDCKRIIVTRGKEGCMAYDAAVGLSEIPALTTTIVDTVGAGDAFLAVSSPIVATGVPIEIAGLIGNAAGALKVGIVGHRSSVEKAPLVKFLTSLLK